MPVVKAPYNGQLYSNEIFASIYNMIISQSMYSKRLSGLDSSLVKRFRTDGSMYGDTKLFYDADILKTVAWGADAEAANLLALDRPADPKCQAINLDQFRQIRLTVDNYLSKRAWSTEGAFSNFNSVMLSYVGKTKKLYDTLLINTYVGTVEGASNRATVEIALSGITATGEEKNRLRAQTIAKKMADLFVDMKDATRDFNDYGFMDAYNTSDLLVIWNSEYVNEITKVDLPTIFHKEGLMEKFQEETLPARYFGHVAGAGTVGQGALTGTVRSLVEKDFGSTHVFPGDIIPSGSVVAAGEAYVVGSDIICKVIHKDAIKYMSGFEVATEFFNPRSLTANHYLTFGYSTPDYIKSYPVITIEED